MKKSYLLIVLTFIVMQLSSYIGVPLFFQIGTKVLHIDPEQMKVNAVGYWILFSFSVGLALVLFLLRKNEKYTKIEKDQPLPVGQSFTWAIIGIFMAFFAQISAGLVEKAIGINPGSENTQQILQLIELFPAIVIISSIIGPILEEIVFRKVIFGSLYDRLPFWVAALLSSVIFALAHFEPVHIILYATMGFVFAFLYVMTKRIIVPIIAHVSMNTIVVILQLFLVDKLEKYIEKTAQFVWWIGGFFS
ncbi:membrane protease YdiL (CAAX protease family) [Bacillus thermophilus]|uniref:Membrane protease YdiL (CAAX protease family) n=1 Tax=Siminovitchia thermophila TaxID=1245522 RepID=A0ABS2RE58_9BACI|nr:type II CAAX endopeptidase family protein [Siminovitchia thermophila]MBM7717484.1 membrane protease YdiL (CAAX protease family) [Siminovitchia thermophila]ONK22557.1 CAAX protease family protein [Bacillus sp. VT-16-64]